MNWEQEDIPDAPLLAISDVALDPESYAGEVIQLTGFLSESIAPDVSFNSAYLGDHPSYGNSEHQMHMIMHSSTGEWIESGSKLPSKASSLTNNVISDGAFTSKDLKFFSTETILLRSLFWIGRDNPRGCTKPEAPLTLQEFSPSKIPIGGSVVLLDLHFVSCLLYTSPSPRDA